VKVKFSRLSAPVAAMFLLAALHAQTTLEYSFTITSSQTWTDTGVDLAAGSTVTISAENKPESSENCSPAGLKSIVGSISPLPVPSASAGALIAKTGEMTAPALVGDGTELKVENSGHLFLGVNLSSPGACSFAVKVRISSGQPGQSLVSAAQGGAPPESQKNPDASGTKSDSASTQHSDLKQQLSSAAQVWLKGQFGSTASSANAASNAVGGASASAVAASPGLKLPTVVLDADLRQHIDGLPRRVHDHAGNAGDMVNFVLVGSEDSMKSALEASDWHLADVDSKEAGLKAVLDTYQKKEYLQMPMSHLYLFDRMQDYGYEQAQAFAVVASRHHFRIWKAPFTWNNQVVWVGAATHDVGFEKDIRTGKLTHKIDPDIDGERKNLAEGLEKSGKTKDITYYLPPNPVQEAKNASAGGYHSDGRLLVVFLK
jgi:hypothetical protein